MLQSNRSDFNIWINNYSLRKRWLNHAKETERLSWILVLKMYLSSWFPPTPTPLYGIRQYC
jgi:hypothetical protein